MTALKKYQRLECTGLWRSDLSAQRREVILSFGKATLVLTDSQNRVLSHWSLIAVEVQKGKMGEFYNIGSNKNLNNLQVTKNLLKVSSRINHPGNKVKIIFVKDRPGHDLRYALNSNKIKKNLKWYPQTSFKEGIKLTFNWYNENKNYYKSLSKKDIVKRLGKK